MLTNDMNSRIFYTFLFVSSHCEAFLHLGPVHTSVCTLVADISYHDFKMLELFYRFQILHGDSCNN